jgi:hypothetical protein
MKQLTLIALLSLLLVSCGHGKTDKMPFSGDLTDSAEVFLIRADTFFGLGISIKVALDDEVIVKLRSGRYTSFFVSPGFHTLSVKNSTVTAAMAQGLRYYFLIKPNDTTFGFEIGRISEERAEPFLDRLRRVN